MTAIPAAFIPPTLSIPIVTAKFSDKLRSWASDPRVVRLRSFTVAQELDASNASTASNTRFEYELIDRITIEVDGKEHDQNSSLIERCSPKVRVLLVRALNKMSMPTEEDGKDFDDSLEVSVP